MGTIAQKLEYLNDTRLLLKDNINKINNVLDDNSTFRSYPQELFNGYINVLNDNGQSLWNALEKVSQADVTEAELSNVVTAPMKIDLKGNTSQETTTGKNLFDKDNEQKIVINPTTGTERYGIIIEAPNKKVSFSGTWLSDNNLAYKLINSETYGSYVSFNSPITIDVQDKILFYNGTENQKLSAIVDKIQIEIGTITSYEPYTGGQPSPNPDYPQEVKVVKGENVVSVSGKNLFKEWISASINPNTGEISATPRNLTDKIFVKSNTTYTMWREDIGFGMYAIEFDKDDNYLATSVIVSADTTRTFTTNANTSYVRLYQYTPYSPTNKAQLEQNSQATPYVPYSKTDYPINLGTLELCKIGDYQDYLYKNNGKWYVHKEINKVVLDGSENWSERTNAINVKQFFVGNTIPVVKNITQYCNYFAKYNQTLYNYGGIGDFAILTNSRQFFGCVNSDLTLENFKTLLATNNMIIYYVLATPTEEEITNTTLIEQLEAISNAKSVKDKTYITQTNDDLPFILDVEAIKEYEVN